MDGIDAAVVDPETHKLIKGITKPWLPQTLRLLEDTIHGRFKTLSELWTVNAKLGHEFSEAVLDLLAQTKLSAKDIQAIGSHGQTILHNPKADFPFSIQIGCPHTIAEKTGITVVADFRARDILAGGQGAPLAPLYHQDLFQNIRTPLAVINIGGIANISCLHASKDIVGFDTGPGNCLMDAFIQHHQHKPYDKDGEWAKSGCLIDELLTRLQAYPFFHESYPKSVDKGVFSLEWLSKYTQKETWLPADIQRTLLHLTAISIANAVKSMPLSFKKLFICGGGAHNSLLLQTISDYLPGVKVQSTAAIHINPDYIEAMLFAWLAKKTLQHEEVDLSAITGAKKRTILGAIYPVRKYP